MQNIFGKANKLFTVAALLLLILHSSPSLANDYLEQKEHYTVMNLGNGVYRFYIPIWVYGFVNDYRLTTTFTNTSGKRHTYTIESLPSWLSVDHAYGAIDPMGEQSVRFTFDTQIAVGEYSDIIYLTDEDGLSEPLQIDYTVEAVPPYDEPEDHLYPYNMSVCAQVFIADPNNPQSASVIPTDENDIVYAFCRNECVGMEHVSFDNITNTSVIYLTVYGTDEMNRQPIRFRLWQASTGKLFHLTPNRSVLFSHGFVYGCGENEPLILTTSGSETQSISLSPGWNWVSTNMDLSSAQGGINAYMSANEPWTDGDLIKNPNTRLFATYSQAADSFAGTLDQLHFSQIYMIYAANGNTMRIAGETLPEDSMRLSVRGDGQWSPMPCLFDQTTPLSEALSDYYQKASPGDLIKARNRFATFTVNRQWAGNLTALQPGEGYLFRRMAPGTTEIRFFKTPNAAPMRVLSNDQRLTTNDLSASTNMTLIAKVQGNHVQGTKEVRVYQGDDLVGVAEPIDSLYFITVLSDAVGSKLRFESEDGTPLSLEGRAGEGLLYSPDAHFGSAESPVILVPTTNDPLRTTKIIEENHIIIIRNNERYDVTGKKLQ